MRPKCFIRLFTIFFTSCFMALSAASEIELAEVPPVDISTVARLSGVDKQTLTVISITSQQKEKLKTYLVQFLEIQKPRLLTYRILWNESRERLRNLESSAAENAFDPCQFVTDEAIEKCYAEVKSARERFEEHCRTAAKEFDNLFGPEQCKIIKNTRSNCGIQSPYRWLLLEPSQKEQIRRFVRVYEARVKLAQKYPQLEKNLSRDSLQKKVEEILTKKQKLLLGKLKKKISKQNSHEQKEQKPVE